MKVRIEGLRDFSRAVAAADKGLKKEIRLVLNDAVDVIVEDSKPIVAEETGAAAKSIRAMSTQTKARVRAGGARAPYYPWLDFGGRVGKYRQVSRPYSEEGRYIYPTYRSKRDSGEFQAKMLEGLEKLGDKAGLDIESG